MALPIVEQQMRINAHDVVLAQHERRLQKLEDVVISLRETCVGLATKEDIAILSKDFNDKFDRRLSEAHKSIPAFAGAIFAAGMFVISLIGLVSNLIGHG